MEKERLKALFWPPSHRRYYEDFEQAAQGLDAATIEQQLSAPTYRHKLLEASLRTVEKKKFSGMY